MNRNNLSVTSSIILINIIVFVVGLVSRQEAILGIPVPGADISEPTLQVMGSYSWFTCFSEGELWRLVTYQFLHANFGHILFNMWALYFFGPALEHIMGPRKYLAYYLSCGVAGALFSSLLAGLNIYSSLPDTQQTFQYVNALVQQFTDYSGVVYPWQMVPMIGASAAVYGVMVAMAFMFPYERISLLFPPVTMSMRTFALIIIGIASLTILFNLDNAGGEAGHLGGIIMGTIIMVIWKLRTLRRRNLY
ncbi:MAG: rhomboid family intramembrane serine protease [Akkermansia sp.]|nr:rhomboid family intramembrane serine protease [Akkermansia sp.]